MKLNFTDSTVFANKWRCGAIFVASICLVWVAFISSSAQLKTQRHVTSLQLGEAGTGARVIINSDLALNDYEAFRRGDHFYVKIPLAEFAFAQPGFHGNGFDDVQVQRVGDGVVISFKLQLGASAHVDQHGNRLDVIFTAPNRGQRNVIPIVAASSVPGGANQNSRIPSNPDRQRDAAGPMPSDSGQVSRARFANARSPQVSAPSQPAVHPVKREGSQGETKALNNIPVASSTPVHSASPTPAPNYPAGPTYAPATTTPTRPTSSKPAGVSASSSDMNKLRVWFSANRNAAMLGALILVVLLVLAAVFLYRSRSKKVIESRAKRPLAQPKFDSKEGLDELTESRKERAPVAVSPVSKVKKSEWSREVSQPRFVAPEVSISRAGALSKPSNTAVAVADPESVSEEREVFEL